MSDLPSTLLAFVVMLGLLIVVHEWGHYAAARLCGVKVLRFSVGFGPALWQTRFGADRTELSVGLFPLGGYVKMLDEREAPVGDAEVSRAFNRQDVGRRSFIVAAGPLANFALAVLLYWGVFVTGTQELLPLMGPPPADSPAAAAGLRNGDQVTAVDGVAVKTWDDLRWMILQRAAVQDAAVLEVRAAGGHFAEIRLPLAAAGEQGWEGDALARLGLRFYRPEIPAVIGRIQPGSPAGRAALRTGDRILAVDGQEIAFWHDMVSIIRQSPGREVRLMIAREGRVEEVTLRPEGIVERGETIGRIGISVAETAEGRRDIRVDIRYGVLEAAGKAARETWEKSVFSLVMFGKMLTGEVSWRNLSGPVTIADYAGQSARLGVDYYLRFMALVSVSLGVLNLLPVPVLDGGHLMYHMLEVVRRRPLSERVMAISQQIGVSLLVVLMAFAFFNDLMRLLNG